jgi:hypothetical protein
MGQGEAAVCGSGRGQQVKNIDKLKALAAQVIPDRRNLLTAVCLGIQLAALFNLPVEFMRVVITLWELGNRDNTN